MKQQSEHKTTIRQENKGQQYFYVGCSLSTVLPAILLRRLFCFNCLTSNTFSQVALFPLSYQQYVYVGCSLYTVYQQYFYVGCSLSTVLPAILLRRLCSFYCFNSNTFTQVALFPLFTSNTFTQVALFALFYQQYFYVGCSLSTVLSTIL